MAITNPEQSGGVYKTPETPSVDTVEQSLPERPGTPSVESSSPPVVNPIAPSTTPIESETVDVQSSEVKAVERVLEEDLQDIYVQLDPATQQTFRQEGEVTAEKVVLLLHQTKIKLRQIRQVIFRWLSMIPGLNKFYLEQEAKLKADKIVDQHPHDHS